MSACLTMSQGLHLSKFGPDYEQLLRCRFLTRSIMSTRCGFCRRSIVIVGIFFHAGCGDGSIDVTWQASGAESTGEERLIDRWWYGWCCWTGWGWKMSSLQWQWSQTGMYVMWSALSSSS